MTRELLEEYLEKVSENTDFTFEITDFLIGGNDYG